MPAILVLRFGKVLGKFRERFLFMSKDKELYGGASISYKD